MKEGDDTENRYLTRIKRWHNKLDAAFAIIAAGLVVPMTLLGVADVVGRYFLNKPIRGTVEIMTFSLGAVAFFSFSYVQLQRGHITVNLLTERLGGKRALLLDTVFLVIMLVTTVIIGWYGGVSAINSWRAGDVSYGTVELPVGPAKMVVPIGCALLSLRLVSQLIASVYGLMRSSGEKIREGARTE